MKNKVGNIYNTFTKMIIGIQQLYINNIWFMRLIKNDLQILQCNVQQRVGTLDRIKNMRQKNTLKYTFYLSDK